MKFRASAGLLSLLILIASFACTTEKTVYVLPDGTEVTPTAAQATQAAGGSSQPAAPQSAQSKSASQSAAPAPSQSTPASTRASAPAPAVNQRWNDKRNTLCSSLGLDASLCENIALDQTQPDGDEQDIDLPDEPDATPVPIDDVGSAVDELQGIVVSEGEVSIQVLTYTENLIQQAADAVVQAEQELANQEATAAYLDAKKQELQELRRTYARLLERIGVAQDRSLALATQIEQEHLAFSIERANGEALIRYKDARLAHTNALAEAEKATIAQIEGIAASSSLPSTYVADTVNLAPLYATKDRAQAQLSEGLREFEQKVHAYEARWLVAYEYYIAAPDSKPSSQFRSSELAIGPYDYTEPDKVVEREDRKELKSGEVTVREVGKGWKDVNLTVLHEELIDADRAILRAIARNEKAQNEAKAYSDESSAIGIAVTNARLAITEKYKEHGISEGRAGAIFRFTDSGEDAVTYNLSLVALNQQADANLADFKNTLAGVIETLHTDIQAASAIRVRALSEAEDVRFSSADTDAGEKQGREEWEKTENLRDRIIMLDMLMMMVGWGVYTIDTTGNYYHSEIPGFWCPTDVSDVGSYWPTEHRTATGIGRDEYIRMYWHKEQPLDRTYTKERLFAVENVLDNLDGWLQTRIDLWESLGKDYEGSLVGCEKALNGDPERNGWQGVREWRQAIIAETTPIPGE